MSLLELALAIGFCIFVGRKIRDYLVKRYADQQKKDEQLKTALDAVSKYPEYRRQSLKIQGELEDKIRVIGEAQAETNARLEKMESDSRRRERNKLRDRLLQSYQYYTDKERNPKQIWSRMEAEAFWGLFSDYEDYDGNGYVHSVVQPAMNLLTVVEMEDIDRYRQPLSEKDGKDGAG